MGKPIAEGAGLETIQVASIKSILKAIKRRLININ